MELINLNLTKFIDYHTINFSINPISPDDYWITEKFDGMRAFWYKGNLISRYGTQLTIPDWLLQILPRGIDLDGELFAGYGKWNECAKFKKKSADIPFWCKNTVFYIVFDIIDNSDTPYYQRYENLIKVISKQYSIFHSKIPRSTFPIQIVKYHSPDLSKQPDFYTYIDSLFNKILKKKGEGIILRNIYQPYNSKYKFNIIRKKIFSTAEGIVIEHKISTSETYFGKLGSLVVIPINSDGQLEHSQKFSVSSGLTKIMRLNYQHLFPIGCAIQYKCNGYTSSGKPRHPVFIKKREHILINSKYYFD
jgi:DNA ligase 1